MRNGKKELLRCNRVEYVENIVFRGVEQFGHTAQNNEQYGYTPDIHSDVPRHIVQMVMIEPLDTNRRNRHERSKSI